MSTDSLLAGCRGNLDKAQQLEWRSKVQYAVRGTFVITTNTNATRGLRIKVEI